MKTKKHFIFGILFILLAPICFYTYRLFGVPDVIEYVIDINKVNGHQESIVRIDFDNQIASMSLQGVSEDYLSSHYDYRIYSDKNWLPWDHLVLDGDMYDESSEFFSKLHFLRDAKAIELRFKNHDNLAFENLKLITFPRKINFDFSFNSVLANGENIRIVTRNEWGADENYRFYDPDNPPPTPKKYVELDDAWMKKYADEIKIVKIEDTDKTTGNKLIWPLEYTENIEKIIIHHSAGRTPNCSEEEDFLRSIYKFHTITRGWGDIGYNYIIGPCSGNVYQGRAGSWGVKGAHAGKFNAKTIGVMLMGNYQEEFPSDNAIDSIVDLSRFLAEKYGFWPNGWSKMRGENLPNIIGHKDVGNTSCPGGNLEVKLPEIRRRASEGFVFPRNPYRVLTSAEDIYTSNIKEQYDAEPIMTNTTQIFLKPSEDEDVVITFKNLGRKTWDKKTYLVIDGATMGLEFNGEKGSQNFVNQKEATVAPNMISSFRVNIKANEKLRSGNFVFSFVPVINGIHMDRDAKYRFAVIILDDEAEPDLDIANTIQIEGIYEEGTSAEGLGTNDLVEGGDSGQAGMTEEGGFSDVTQDNIFYEYINDLKSAGIISGQNGKFYPDREITRGEFSKILVNASSLDSADSNRSFSDIAGTTFEGFIRILQSHQIVKGQNGKFLPDQFVTRAEAIKMVVNTFGLDGETGHIYKDMKGSDFEPFVLKAAANGIIGQGSIFDPDAPITRDQVAKIISKARNLDGDSGQAGMTEQAFDNQIQGDDAGENGPIVRVDLNFLEDDFTLSSTGEFSVYSGDNLLRDNMKAGDQVLVELKDGNYQVSMKGSKYYKSGPIRVVQKEGEIIELIGKNKLGGEIPFNKYRGTIEIRIDPENEGKLYVINELPLETYIAGLGEEPGHEPEEKIKTVIVMARSYMEYYRRKGGKFPDRFVDLKSDGATSQVYLGYDFETRHDAVPRIAEETRGEVITYDGDVIRAPYFSKSGGHTITPGTEGNEWNPASFPFAVRVEDPWSCGEDLEYLQENGPIECPDEMRGHGVGLSAWGARKMAEEGKGYEEIIKYYLTGVELDNLDYK